MVETKISEAPKTKIEPITTPGKTESARPKTTLSISNILKTPEKKEVIVAEAPNSKEPDRPVTKEALTEAWQAYAAERKNQVAEYHLLTRDFDFENNQITLQLSNPIEEPLLQSMKTALVTYLRERLHNSSIHVTGQLQEITTAKKAYTNKEKFEQLASKNPFVKELKDKFGLDPDF